MATKLHLLLLLLLNHLPFLKLLLLNSILRWISISVYISTLLLDSWLTHVVRFSLFLLTLQLILFLLVLTCLYLMVSCETCLANLGNLILLSLKLPTAQFFSIPAICGVYKCSILLNNCINGCYLICWVYGGIQVLWSTLIQ